MLNLRKTLENDAQIMNKMRVLLEEAVPHLDFKGLDMMAAHMQLAINKIDDLELELEVCKVLKNG